MRYTKDYNYNKGTSFTTISQENYYNNKLVTGISQKF